jgi:hypothetical protein
VQLCVGSSVHLDLQGEGGAGLGLGLQPAGVDGVHHVGEGDGGDRTRRSEGGHIRDQVSVGRGGGHLQGVERGRVRQDCPCDWLGLVGDNSSRGSCGWLGPGLADSCIVMGLGALGAGFPECLAVLFAAGLAGVTRVATPTVVALGVREWCARARGLGMLQLGVGLFPAMVIACLPLSRLSLLCRSPDLRGSDHTLTPTAIREIGSIIVHWVCGFRGFETRQNKRNYIWTRTQ